MAFPCQRMLALVLLLPAPGWMDQPSLPCTSWVPMVEHCPWLCPIPAAAPSPGCSLALAVPFHVLAQALWPGLVMEEPSFLLVVLPSPPGWGRTTSGLCPYLSQHCAISDCIFGIKSELLLHPLGSRLARFFILAPLRLLVTPVLLSLTACRFSLFSLDLSVAQRRKENEFGLGCVVGSPV